MPKPHAILVYLGFDSRRVAQYVVARHSILRRAKGPVEIIPLDLEDLQNRGLYTRPIQRIKNQMFDVISQAPMSTEFSLSRFWVPLLENYQHGFSIYMDSDIVCTADIFELLNEADRGTAVSVVKRTFAPATKEKMDGQQQVAYRCKNWSSVMIFNLGHEDCKRLDPHTLNKYPGLYFHNFDWADAGIGRLPPVWNHLIGHDSPEDKPKLLHFTDGTPDIPGYEQGLYSAVWWAELHDAIRNPL